MAASDIRTESTSKTPSLFEVISFPYIVVEFLVSHCILIHQDCILQKLNILYFRIPGSCWYRPQFIEDRKVRHNAVPLRIIELVTRMPHKNQLKKSKTTGSLEGGGISNQDYFGFKGYSRAIMGGLPININTCIAVQTRPSFSLGSLLTLLFSQSSKSYATCEQSEHSQPQTRNPTFAANR